MCSNRYSNITKILICFIMFFSFGIGVKAKDLKETNKDNLFEYCNDDNKCIPVCIYTCIGEKKGDTICSIANNDKNKGALTYIGHYYTNGGSYDIDENGLTKVWEISTIPVFGTPHGVLPTTTLFTWRDSYFIKSDKITSNKQKWSETSEYNEMKNSMICPKANSVKNSFGINVEFGNGSGTALLSYSFIDEFKKVLEDAEMESDMFNTNYEDISKNDRINEFLKIMAKANIDDSYDASKTAEENIKKFCEKNNANDAKSYIEQVDVEKTINTIFSMSLENINVRYPQVYNLNSLKSLLTSSSESNSYIVDENGKKYNDRIANLYKDINTTMITYFNEECGWNINADELQQTTTEELISITHEITPIDFDNSQFDCDTLFGGEIAKIISGAYFIIELAALGILIIFTVIDYAKVILNGESDEIKKQNQKLIKRLIIVVVLFILPAIVNTTLRLFHIEGFNSEHPLCIQISNK